MKFPGDTGMTPSDVAANTPLIENKEIQVQRANLLDIVDIMKGIKNIGTILLYHNIFGSQNFDINYITKSMVDIKGLDFYGMPRSI